MKPALLNAYLLMLPRLQAEEALLQRAVIASGTGSFKAADDKRFVKDLQKQAHVVTGKRIRTLDDLRATGIPIQDERRKKVTPGG